jgi:hypothetical protein
MTDKNEELAALDAVAAVLVDKLHTTEDEELQAGLIQLLQYVSGLEQMLDQIKLALGL